MTLISDPKFDKSDKPRKDDETGEFRDEFGGEVKNFKGIAGRGGKGGGGRGGACDANGMNFVSESFKTFDNENYMVADTPVSVKFTRSKAFQAYLPEGSTNAMPTATGMTPTEIPRPEAPPKAMLASDINLANKDKLLPGMGGNCNIRGAHFERRPSFIQKPAEEPRAPEPQVRPAHMRMSEVGREDPHVAMTADALAAKRKQDR